MSWPEQRVESGRIGSYRLLRRLGMGGMAITYIAAREGPGGFEQRVCLKRIRPELAADPDLRRLLLREARLAAALTHRNIVRVVELGLDDSEPYLALELVDGLDLRHLLRHAPGGRLPVAEVRLIAQDLAEALDHAHRRGHPTGPIVHRDVTPSNVLVSVDGEVRLTDFGIAKSVGEDAARSQRLRGNVWYMAPEQLEGPPGQADPRMDLYALGSVIYHCLTGARPYATGGIRDALTARFQARLVPAAALAPQTPQSLLRIIDGLLTRRPGDRLASAAQLLDALSSVTEPVAVRRTLATRVLAAQAAMADAPPVGPPVRRAHAERPSALLRRNPPSRSLRSPLLDLDPTPRDSAPPSQDSDPQRRTISLDESDETTLAWALTPVPETPQPVRWAAVRTPAPQPSRPGPPPLPPRALVSGTVPQTRPSPSPEEAVLPRPPAAPRRPPTVARTARLQPPPGMDSSGSALGAATGGWLGVAVSPATVSPNIAPGGTPPRAPARRPWEPGPAPPARPSPGARVTAAVRDLICTPVAEVPRPITAALALSFFVFGAVSGWCLLDLLLG